MGKQLRLQVSLGVLDKVTAPLKRMTSSAQKLETTLFKNKEQLKKLEKTQSFANTFSENSIAADNLRTKLRSLTSTLDKAKAKLSDTEGEFLSLRGQVGNATQAYKKNKAAITALNLELAVAKNAKEKDSAAIAEMTQRLRVNRAQLAVERDALAAKTTTLKNLTNKMQAEKEEVKRLSHQHQLLTDERREALITLKKHHHALRAAGISSKDLVGEQSRLQQQLNQTNAAMEKQQRHLDRLKTAQSRFAKGKAIADDFLRMSGNTAMMGFGISHGGQSIVRGLGRGAGVFSGFIQTAADFEKFETILKTTEGSREKAKASMDWISQFAVKTPYELNEVTESFVKLRTYGLDPTNGLLETLGDTSAAMGRPMIQAIEAIADAVTGENERLKEFGITASTKGDTITYNYTDAAGVQRFVKAAKNNRKEIEETLTAIWQEKYGGSMNDLL